MLVLEALGKKTPHLHIICINTQQIFQKINCLNPTNLNRRHFGLLITKVCHLGMWNVNMHQISYGALHDKANVI